MSRFILDKVLDLTARLVYFNYLLSYIGYIYNMNIKYKYIYYNNNDNYIYITLSDSQHELNSACWLSDEWGDYPIAFIVNGGSGDSFGLMPYNAFMKELSDGVLTEVGPAENLFSQMVEILQHD